MAGEIQAQHVTGAALYAVLLDSAGGVWNGDAFDASPTAAEWASYDIAMTEGAGSGCYRADLPGVGVGRYSYRVHKQLGGSPASTDPVVWTGEINTSMTPAEALADYDPPTQAEMTAALAGADDAVLAAIAALNDLSLSEVEDAIAAGSGATPATFWQYNGPGGRTLTPSMINVLRSMIEGSNISITRGDTTTITLTGLGNLEDRTKLWFTVKARPATETDAQAKIQIVEGTGLVRLNGAAGTAGWASIVAPDEVDGDVTITLSADLTAALAVGGAWRWDIQVAQPGPGTWTPRTGAFTVGEDVTRAVGP